MTGRQRKLVITATLLVTLLSLISVSRSICGGRPKRDYGPSKLVGQVIAEETCKLLGDRGDVVVLAGDAGAQRAQLSALRKVLKGKPAIHILAIRELKSEEIGLAAVRGQIPWRLFRQALEQNPTSKALISLLGPPEMTPEAYEEISRRSIRLVVFAPMGIGIKDLLADDVVQVAVVPRMGATAPMPNIAAPAMPVASSSPERARFDAQYLVLTPSSNLSAFSEPVPPPLPPQNRPK